MTRRARARRIRSIILPALLGAAAGVLVVRLGLPVGSLTAEGSGVVVLLALPLVWLACVVVHEAGHVAGALLVDFRPLLFIAGPLRAERVDGRMRWGLNRSLALAGGLAASAPIGLHDLRGRTLVMVAGGPVASLMLGAQSLAIWMALNSAGRAAGTASGLLVFVGIMSLLIGVITLMPVRSGGFYSDGARMLRLLRNDAQTDAEVALLALTAQSLGGLRPRDWDAMLVQRALATRDGGAFEVGAHQFAYAHALDRGDIDAAREYLNQAIARAELLPPPARDPLRLAAATFFALFDNDAARSRELLEQTGTRSLLNTPHQRQLARAAVLLAEGDLRAAAEAARQARDLIPKSLDRGGSALDDALAVRIINAGIAAG